MALPAHLARDLRRTLRALRAAGDPGAVPGGSGKALEAWLLLKLAEAAGQGLAPWTVSLRTSNGSALAPGAPFLFASGQSGIPPASRAGPGFVLLESPTGDPDHALELHGGLRWEGRSGSTHECDVSAIPRTLGAALRANGGGHPRGLPIAALECKDKSGSATVDEMRQTLARMYDLAIVTRPVVSGMMLPGCRTWAPGSGGPVQWGRHSSMYLSFFSRGLFGVVRREGFQSGANTLAGHYSIRRYGEIYRSGGKTLRAVRRDFKQVLDSVDSL